MQTVVKRKCGHKEVMGLDLDKGPLDARLREWSKKRCSICEFEHERLVKKNDAWAEQLRDVNQKR